MNKDIEKLTDAYGEVKTLIGPSGHEFTIRMQTGEDDDILSNAKGVLDGSSANRFISGIVVHTDFSENGRLSIDKARELKLSDRYFLMIASRIFSLGQKLIFEYEWSDGKSVEYEEDLGQYIWDYHNEDNPFPYKGDPDYFSQRIPEHRGGKNKTRMITLSTGKNLRYNFMDGNAERWLLKLPQELQSVNSGILARGLELKMAEDWVKVQNFKSFNPREMMEIRIDIEDYDPAVDLITTLTHPDTGEKVEFPVVASQDFFYPRQI